MVEGQFKTEPIFVLQFWGGGEEGAGVGGLRHFCDIANYGTNVEVGVVIEKLG